MPLRCFGQNHHYCSDTASSFHSFPLPVTHVFFFAVLLRNQGGITAEPLRCHCEHGDPIELSLRFNCGTTAIIGGRTTVIAAALRGQWGATEELALLVRCYCGGVAAAGRLHDVRAVVMGCGFRSYYRFRCCWGRCYCYYCYDILLLFLSLSYAAEKCYCTAVVLRRHGGDGCATAVLVRCQGGHGGAAAIPLRIGPTRGGTAEVLNMSKVSAVPPWCSAVLTVFRGATAINDGTTVEPRRSLRCHCGLCRTITTVTRASGVAGVLHTFHITNSHPVVTLKTTRCLSPRQSSPKTHVLGANEGWQMRGGLP